MTFASIRCSRNASTWLVTDPHVVTVSVALRRPDPGTRTQTFASRLEMSIPAHRGCTTSITANPSASALPRSKRFARDLGTTVRRIEGGKHFTPQDHPDVIAEETRSLAAEVAPR